MSTEGVETFPFEDGDGAADPSPGGWREQVRETLARSIAGAKRVNIAVWMTLFLGLAAFFLYRERRELVDIGHVLRTANPLWLLAGLLVEVVIQLLFAAKHVQLFRMLGKRVPIGPVTEANLQRHLFSTLVPAGGPPSVLLLIRKLSRYGVTADDIVLVTVLFSVLGHTSFAIFLLPVVGWLVIHHNASSLVLFGTVALVVIVLLMFGALMLLLGGIRVPGQVEARIPRRARVFVDQARSHGITPRRLAPPLLFAIGVDVFGAVLLWASLRAVGVHSSIAVAAAGYAVGTLFLLLAPVFQGIGVVELSMAVSLQRLGVSKVEALGATVLYRVGELWLPLLVAVAIQERTRKGARAAPALFPALLTGVTGLLSVLSVLAPSIPRRMNRLQAYSRFAPADASRTFTLVAGFLLIFLSYSLLRRKRVAWIVAMGVLSGALVTHLGKRHDYVVAIVAAVNLASLWVYRRCFRVRSDLPTIRQGLIQFAGSVSFALAYGTLGFWLLDKRDFGISFSLWESLDNTIRLFFFLNSDDLRPRTRYADWFLDSFSVVGLVAILFAVYALVRPVVWRRRTLPHEREDAARLVAEHGGSSLDFFKTTDDKIIFLSSSRRGFVGYSVAGGVAVSLGDPVATDEAEFGRVLREFVDFCDANDWRVAFHQTPPTRLRHYADLGFSTVKIGEEAVVDLTAFTLEGRGMKSIRSACNKLEKGGFRAVSHPAPQSPEILARLHAVSEAWLDGSGRRERRFTLGQWNAEYIRACDVMTIEDERGDVYAFANLIPDGLGGEATIDLMRHRADGPNGMMEVLFVRLFEDLGRRGFRSFSMGMVPFAEVGSGPDSTTLEKGIFLLGEHLGRFFSSKGLREFKDKFGPSWEGRFLVYPSEVALPAITFALVRLTE